MNYERLFRKAEERIVKTALAGAGEFGWTFVFQAQRAPNIDVPVIINRTVSKAVEAFVNAGIGEGEIAVCDSSKRARESFERGKRVVVSNIEHAVDLSIDVLVEATGSPEVGANNAETALDNGWHVVMASKEVDSVVGPELTARAGEKGLVYTPADGDQPSLLIGLISWAKTLGLSVVAAGKSSEYDLVYHPENGVVVTNGIEIPAGNLDDLWFLGERKSHELFESRRRLLSQVAQSPVPDLCEIGLVANATGMKPDHAVFHSPIVRPVEVPDFVCPRHMGGLLEREGTLDIINCLRRADEASMSGGVFVIVECQDAKTWKILAHKGHPVSRNGRCAMVYRPFHLLGVETVTSVLSAAILGQSTGNDMAMPVCDLVGRAAIDLKAGQVLDMGGHHHTIEGVDAELADASPVYGSYPVPFYLMAHRKLLCDVPSGTLITAGMVDLDMESTLYRIRKLQDRRFFGN
jgi:predicted homoserine dehydrogenase-like protein